MIQIKRHNLKMRKSTQRSGYVLVVTLLIIAMVSILTVGLARHSMNMAVASITMQDELQSRWGSASCQRFALRHQRVLLAQRSWNEETKSWDLEPIPRSACGIQLGDQMFAVRLDDESAKLSVNHLAEYSSRAKTASVVRELADTREFRVELRPLADSKRRGPTEQAYECWGQVFASDGESGTDPSVIRDVTGELTCWSDKLNYQTASDEVLLESVKLLVGGAIARRILELRESGELKKLNSISPEIGATESQTRALAAHLTNRSTAQSVWVEAISQRRHVHTLTIREEFTSSISRYYSFTW